MKSKLTENEKESSPVCRIRIERVSVFAAAKNVGAFCSISSLIGLIVWALVIEQPIPNLLNPVFQCSVGLITGTVLAATYNFTASKIGGLEFQIVVLPSDKVESRASGRDQLSDVQST